MILSEKRKKILLKTFMLESYWALWTFPKKYQKLVDYTVGDRHFLLFKKKYWGTEIKICQHGLLCFYNRLCENYWRLKKESILLKIGTGISDIEKAKISLCIMKVLLPKLKITVVFKKCNLNNKYHVDMFDSKYQANTLETKLELNAIAIEENSDNHETEHQRQYEMYAGREGDDPDFQDYPEENEDFIPWKYRRLYDFSKQANKRFKRVKLWK
jgi:hypothetical protein